MNGDVPPIRYIGVVRRLLSRLITKRQLLILSELKENGDYITVTNLIQKISEERKIPASTLRYGVRRLVSYGIIVCGNASSKGTPARLTADGELLLKMMGGDER